ncbi:MAG TPA: aminotransferase class III-fold pyridoxal phosphate-dependent enzyme [Burkholderiaceae bacterium]|nr:aminotransferase class III-fold pyridoxal phosphate-dependent enzyme [Burkholderiaceae bacterium]
MNELITLGAAAAAILGAGVPPARRRLMLSRAKHPSLAGHARIGRRLARLVRGYHYDESRFFDSDGAPAEVAARRRAAMLELSATFHERFRRTLELTQRARPLISDLQFTGRYRVPFQYSRLVRNHLGVGAFVAASDGLELIDLDGNRLYDLSGSYGVNLFGYDFYKRCIAEGSARVQALGPVLGAYHPAVADVVARLRAISGLDEVSFHMSGTEAVMQAVRLARYHTGRSHVVRFCGAYHGWWDDVQPGVGSPRPARETYTLRDLDERSLRVLATRRDIACVLVNPLQALHPNRSAPGDSTLVDGSREAGFDRAAYTRWLRRLREVCSARRIVLIFDEVFVGFRLAPGGAQQYFGVRADLVTYGKTLGGGLPVGVLCGRADLMKRYRDDRPADICFARGTFNAHPYVIGAMQVFLERCDDAPVRALYRDLDERWDRRAASFNERLQAAGVPLRVDHLSSIWTVSYTRPGRYHWMLQYYLRAHGILLSWVGTGRMIFSLDWSDEAFDAMSERFIAAARAMQADGWWWADATLTRQSIRRRLLHEMLEQWGLPPRFMRRGARASGRSVDHAEGETATSSTA